VDCCAYAQFTNALYSEIGTFFWAGSTFRSILDGNLGKTDADGPNITSKDVSSVESFAGPNGIIETLEVNLVTIRDRRSPKRSTTH
jgi:hypothetical protein